MSVKVNELSKLHSLSHFRLVAGEKGLSNEVSTVCLADLEVDKELVPYANGIRRGSFVISSLRHNLDLSTSDYIQIFDALMEHKVSAFSYNEKMVKKLPDKVLDMCNANALPVFAFNPEEVYIENVVFDIMHTIQEKSVSFSMDREIEKMLREGLSKAEVEGIATSINPNFHRNCIVAYIKAKDKEAEFSPGRIARSYAPSYENDSAVTTLLPFREGLLVIITMPRMDLKLRDKIIYDIVEQIPGRHRVMVACGSEQPTFDGLDRAVRECNHAYITGKLEDLDWVEYDDIGTYKFLIPNRNHPEEIAFMRKYMRNMSKEQLETAIVFVKCNGSFDKAAEKLICHRNTVRYRINKIHERTDPDKSEFQFYENLSAAIKIYMISGV